MNNINLRQLRRQRIKRYWMDIIPYFRYVGNSALGFMLIIGLSFYGYGYFVHHLPEQFPVYAAVAIALTIPVYSGGFRTHLREADVVFLLPIETHMTSYLKACLRSAYIRHIITITVIWQILWPLYQVRYEHSLYIFFTIWLQLVLIKGIVLLGVWKEHQLQQSRTRITVTWLRLIMIGLIIYLTLTQALAWSLLFIGIVSIIYLLSLQAASAYTIHWDRLIMLEQRSRSRWITFFNFFVEMPLEHSLVRQTHLLHRIANLIAFKSSNAYHYLYLITLMRSDLFRVIGRLLGFAVIVLLMLNSIWMKLVLLVLFAYVIKLQLSELGRYHKHVEMSSVYPVKSNQRVESARLISIYVYGAALVLLLISFLISFSLH